MTLPTPAAASQGGLSSVPQPLTTFQRLDVVEDHLVQAESAIAVLVQRLEPVLPFGFGSETAPPVPVRQPVDSSPLASRLDAIAVRGQDLVQRLGAVLNAVDL